MHSSKSSGLGSSSSSSSPPPASAGVDLNELERLRVLVRYEFDGGLGDLELLEALRSSHNNLREAYHLLKTRHRRPPLATTTMAPAVNGNDNGNGNGSATKRRSSGDDGPRSRTSTTAAPTAASDDSTPSKRFRSLAVSLSQERSPTQPTPPTQTPTPTLTPPQSQTPLIVIDDAMDGDEPRRPESPAVDVLAAKRLIDVAIGNYMCAADMDGEQWAGQVMSALGAETHEGIERGIDVVTAAIANALQHVASGDIRAVKEDALNQMMEVLLHIPRADDFTLAHAPESPTEDELAQQLAVANTLYDSVTAASSAGSTPGSSRALPQAITALTEACRGSLRRLEWFRHAAADTSTRLHEMAGKLELVGQALCERLRQSGGTVETTEREMTAAQTAFREHSAALNAAIDARISELVAQGVEPLDADLDANEEMVLSTVPAIVQKREARAASRRRLVARKAEVMRANTYLEFFQKLQGLFTAVAEERTLCNQRVVKNFDASRRVTEKRVLDHLCECVPKLTKVLGWHFEYISKRQQLADRDRQAQEKALATHDEIYEDLAPSAREDIQKRLREFSGAMARAAQQMREAASAQGALWAGAAGVLPPELVAAIVGHYARLAEGLPSEARAVLRASLAPLHHADSAASGVAVSASIKVEAMSPTAAAGTMSVRSLAGSPVIDLTGDDATDDRTREAEMDEPIADDLARRIDFDAPTTTRIPSPPEPVSDDDAFGPGAVVFTKMNVGDEEETRFVRGRVEALEADGAFRVVYDDGDVFCVPRAFLFTRAQMEADERLQQAEVDKGPPETAREALEAAAGRCAIM